MAKCRGCGEEIIFIKSPAGKFIESAVKPRPLGLGI